MEAFAVLGLWASFLIGGMTVVSEVPTDSLMSDLVMTSRKDITHITVEGVMTG